VWVALLEDAPNLIGVNACNNIRQEARLNIAVQVRDVIKMFIVHHPRIYARYTNHPQITVDLGHSGISAVQHYVLNTFFILSITYHDVSTSCCFPLLHYLTYVLRHVR